MSSMSQRGLLYLTVVATTCAGFGIWAYRETHSPAVVAVAIKSGKEPKARGGAGVGKQPERIPAWPHGDEPAPFNVPPRFFQKGFKGFGKKARANLSERLGIRVEKPSEDTMLQLGLAETDGLIVEEVRAGSIAESAGMKVGDILLALDGQNVPSDLDQFHFQLENLKTSQAIDAVLLRDGKMATLKGIVLPESGPRFTPRRQFDN